jgi:hypothetical protein
LIRAASDAANAAKYGALSTLWHDDRAVTGKSAGFLRSVLAGGRRHVHFQETTETLMFR